MTTIDKSTETVRLNQRGADSQSDPLNINKGVEEVDDPATDSLTGTRVANLLVKLESRRRQHNYSLNERSKARYSRVFYLQTHHGLGKLQALWISAWNLGLIRTHRLADLWEFSFRNHLGTQEEVLQNSQKMKALTSHLMNWLARDAQVDWSCPDPKQAVARAQYRRLMALEGKKGERLLSNHGFSEMAYSLSGINGIVRYSDSDWQLVINKMGERLRERLERRKSFPLKADYPLASEGKE